MPRAKKCDIPDGEWDRLEPVIREMYLQENKTLKDMIVTLGVIHNFHPSKAQLEYKLKQWHMTKNLTTMQWKYVSAKIRKRESQKKESRVYLSGIPLSQQTIAKATGRYCYDTAVEKAIGCEAFTPPPPTDISLIIRTPSPELESNLRYRHSNNLPWFQTSRSLKDLKLIISQHIPNCNESGNQLLARRLFQPTVAVATDTALSHTANLQYAFEALSLIMPEETQGQNVSRAENLLCQSNPNRSEAGTLEFAMFLLSNNFPATDIYTNNSKIRILFDLVFDAAHRAGIWDFIATQQFSEFPLGLQSILQVLFEEAVRRSDLTAIRSLLKGGFFVDQSFRGLYWINVQWTAGRAFEYAALVNNTELMQILVEFGADTRCSLVLLTSVWQRETQNSESRDHSTKTILSGYTFSPKDESRARELLYAVSGRHTSPGSEMIIHFFRTKLRRSSSITQLLITAIRTESIYAEELCKEYRDYINSPTTFGETPLSAAAAEGNLKACDWLLQLGAHIDNAQTVVKSEVCIASPLQCAAFFAETKVVQKLLINGAKINLCHLLEAEHCNACDDGVRRRKRRLDDGMMRFGILGKTALQAALIGGNADTALLLLNEGADIVGPELTFAIRNRMDSIVQYLLALNIQPAGSLTEHGTGSSLEAAVLVGNFRWISHIINTNPRTITAQVIWAATWYAAHRSDTTIVNYLLDHAIDLCDPVDCFLGTALSLAAALGLVAVAERLLNSGYRPKTSRLLFSDAAQRTLKGDDDAARGYEQYMLLTDDCDTETERHLYPIIEVAPRVGGIDYLEILLKNGYELTSGFRLVAEECGNLQYLQWLFDHGIPMTTEALTKAIEENDTEMLEWLLSLQIDLNPPRSSETPRTPLQAAVWSGNMALMDRLINLGANINAPADISNVATALQLACVMGHFGIVQRLLEMGADINAPASLSGGRTALEGAAEHARLDTIQLLLHAGVETLGSGRRQFVRATKFAATEHHCAVVKLLKAHRPWTEADEEIYGEKHLLHCNQYPGASSECSQCNLKKDTDTSDDNSDNGSENDSSDDEGCMVAVDDITEERPSEKGIPVENAADEEYTSPLYNLQEAQEPGSDYDQRRLGIIEANPEDFDGATSALDSVEFNEFIQGLEDGQDWMIEPADRAWGGDVGDLFFDFS